MSTFRFKAARSHFDDRTYICNEIFGLNIRMYSFLYVILRMFNCFISKVGSYKY